ncbi:hypothetical protein [Pseudomonas frederiksbergensis]|uniref:Uncharacterized protein n=1 Tax=Pseudomonas frederiksbergensis TaxID=104087 RepID=A0A6L5C363_9PSED|nr:hypothetical protein [Pseudomonas frederiksbergensis]KAF2395426.1 hypothetical protein FX983_03411 [Pseudomonas frederiksbergensis]
MKTNQLNAYTLALGALKLIPIYLNCPGVISRATLVGASTEAIQLLETMPALSTELAEVFRCVNNVIHEGQIAYVTPTNSPEYPFGAVVADAKGNVCAAGMGKSKEGLAELIRLKLVPPTEGLGEVAA